MSWQQFWSISCQSGGKQVERVSFLLFLDSRCIFARIAQIYSTFFQGCLASLRQRLGFLPPCFPSSIANASLNTLTPAFYVITR